MSGYDVADPGDDPSAVSTPPPKRRPKGKQTTEQSKEKSTTTTAADTTGTNVDLPWVAPDTATPVDPPWAMPNTTPVVPAPILPPLLPETPAAQSRYVPTVEAKPVYTRVSFITDAGVYSVPALAVEICDYGVMVTLPSADDQASFVPAIGSTLTIGHKSTRVKCYFPGTEFNTSVGKVLVFIKAGDDNGEA